jgi:hypothetical protein
VLGAGGVAEDIELLAVILRGILLILSKAQLFLVT